MADTATLDRAPAGAAGSDLRHIVCCDDDVALCGEDVSGEAWSDRGPVCIPCEVEWQFGKPCPVTGCTRGERR